MNETVKNRKKVIVLIIFLILSGYCILIYFREYYNPCNNKYAAYRAIKEYIIRQHNVPEKTFYNSFYTLKNIRFSYKKEPIIENIDECLFSIKGQILEQVIDYYARMEYETKSRYDAKNNSWEILKYIRTNSAGIKTVIINKE